MQSTARDRFNRMLSDYAPMWFIVGEELRGDPWIFKTLRCLNCTEVYMEMRRVGDTGTRCPNCFDLDKDFKWERTSGN